MANRRFKSSWGGQNVSGTNNRNNSVNSQNFSRGICPDGRPIAPITWSRLNQAVKQSQTGGGQSVYQDYNGDGVIDILDLIYFMQ